MITKQEKIDAIYEKIAERNIKKINDQIAKITCKPVMIGDVIDWIEKKTKDKINKAHFSARLDEKSMKITAPLEKEKEIKINILLGSWNELRNPIENQCEHCIRFVYYLISE